MKKWRCRRDPFGPSKREAITGPYYQIVERGAYGALIASGLQESTAHRVVKMHNKAAEMVRANFRLRRPRRVL